MTVVTIQGVGKVTFPDSMSADEIQQAIESDILPQVAPEAPKQKPLQYTASADSTAGRIMRGLDTVQGAPYVGPVITGALDPSKAIAQMALHAGNAVAPSFVNPENFDNNLAVNEQNYQQSRVEKGGKANSFDGGRLLGNVAVTAPFMRQPTPSDNPLGMMVNALKNGGAGAGFGILQPVTDPKADFWAEKMKQAGGGAVGGIIAPPIVQKVVDAASAGINALVQKGASSVASFGGNLKAQAEQLLSAELSKNGIDFSKLTQDVKDSLLGEVQNALKVGGALLPDALRRKADFLMVGGKPTLGKITLDPTQISREHTLKGVQGAGRELVDADVQNNQALITALNKSGAAEAKGAYQTGEMLFNAGKSALDKKQATVTALYDKARSLNGGEIPLDHLAFINQASSALDKNFKTKFLPAEIKGIMNDIAEGKIPLNISVAEQLKTTLATASRATQDGNVKAAISFVRDALENAPAQTGQGEKVIQAFNAARAANRALRTQVENTPALKAIEDGMPVDKFFQTHVLNAPVRDLQATIKALNGQPEAVTAMRTQLVEHLKDKALSGASDEVGKFSQSGYNKALNAIPEEKLALLFNKDEIAQLRTVGRVASYNQVQPAGSTVNNSSTAAQLFNLLMKMAEKVPFGKAAVVQPAQALINSGTTKTALRADVPVNIIADPFVTPARQQQLVRLLAPALTAAVPSLSR